MEEGVDKVVGVVVGVITIMDLITTKIQELLIIIIPQNSWDYLTITHISKFQRSLQSMWS